MSCFRLSLGGSGTVRTRYLTSAAVAGLFLLCAQAPRGSGYDSGLNAGPAGQFGLRGRSHQKGLRPADGSATPLSAVEIFHAIGVSMYAHEVWSREP